MAAMLTTILAFFTKFMIAMIVAKIASFLVFTTISITLIRTLMDQAMSYMGQAGDLLWFAQMAGLDVFLSSIGSALILRATFRAWSVGPGAAITGG